MGEILDILTEGGPIRILIYMGLITAIVVVAALMVERRIRHRARHDDYERLVIRSRRLRCSEYDIFLNAARRWQIPQHRVDEDFKLYLYYGDIPHYVRHHLRTEPEPEREPEREDTGEYNKKT